MHTVQHPAEQQATALVAAALSLLKRNLPQPFSHTLLNIGATGFAAQQQPGGAMPPVFARLLSRGEACGCASCRCAAMCVFRQSGPLELVERAF